MAIRSRCLPALSLALCTTVLGSASAHILNEIVSQGSSSAITGDMYSQGMRAPNGPWAGYTYSQGMMTPFGVIYSQGMEISLGSDTPDSGDADGALGGGTASLGGTPKPSAGGHQSGDTFIGGPSAGDPTHQSGDTFIVSFDPPPGDGPGIFLFSTLTNSSGDGGNGGGNPAPGNIAYFDSPPHGGDGKPGWSNDGKPGIPAPGNIVYFDSPPHGDGKLGWGNFGPHDLPSTDYHHVNPVSEPTSLNLFGTAFLGFLLIWAVSSRRKEASPLARLSASAI
jgi:hypothetical protein